MQINTNVTSAFMCAPRKSHIQIRESKRKKANVKITKQTGCFAKLIENTAFRIESYTRACGGQIYNCH